MRKPGQERPTQSWQADDPVGRDRAGREDEQLVFAHVGRVAAGVEGHVSVRQQLTRRLRGGRPEQLERLRFGGHERELHAAQAELGHVRRGHKRQLVERERPRRTRGDRECHPRDAALLEMVQHGAEAARVTGPLHRHAAGNRGRGLRADRE